MYAEFDISLVTGNDEIDGQHKEWIDRINKLLECYENGGEKIEAIKMLEYMADYTEFHFAAEEKLQESVEYPALDEHREKHDEFRKVVEELHEMLEEEEGPSQRFVEAVQKNVVDWLYTHIRTYDCSVATYMNMNFHPDLV